jgi:hypothetical protein
MAMATTRWRLMAGFAVVTLAASIGQAAIVGQSSAKAGTQTEITVDVAQPGGQLSSDFVGLSYEMRELGVGNLDATTGNLAALFRTLGRSNVRISGNTLDRDTLWVPRGQAPPNPLPSWVQDVVTPADIVRLGRFLDATGWKAEVGVSMGHFDAGLATDEARTLDSVLGRHLVAVECGNEPNSYASNGLRTAPYGYPQYKPEWEACADAVGNSRIAGPDTSSPTKTGAWVSQFAQDELDRVSMLTIHNYPVSSTATISELLSPQTDASEVSQVATELAAAQAEHLPIRIDETNSAAGGGIPGVSDAYASALWAMDYSLLMAQDGFNGINFHGGQLAVCDGPLFNGKFQLYTPICAANAADQQAKIYTAAPEYYGLYMAARMGPGQFLPVAVSSDSNLTAYAVRGNDGHIRIALIEKDDTSAAPVPVSIKVGTASGVASVIHLTGSSLGSSQGVAVQGATVDRQGHLIPGRANLVPVRDGTLSLDLPSGSAEIITLR